MDEKEPIVVTETKYEPKEKAEVVVASVNGIRILWNGPHKCTVERLDEDECKQMAGVQRVEVIFDAKEALPIIKIDEVAIPKVQNQYDQMSFAVES